MTTLAEKIEALLVQHSPNNAPGWWTIFKNAARDELAAARPSASAASVVAEVAAERRRQVDKEGWSHQHDDEHDAGTLACAGAAYALNAGCVLYPLNGTPMEKPPEFWMWGEEWWKPKSPRRDLVRAAALMVAEIERMDRAADRTAPTLVCPRCGADRYKEPCKESVVTKCPMKGDAGGPT